MSWKRNLQSVGIKIFIEYFELFNSSLSVSEIMERLPDVYTENAKRTRINAARRIIKNKFTKEVLKYIINDAKKIDGKTKKEAKKIFNRYE